MLIRKSLICLMLFMLFLYSSYIYAFSSENPEKEYLERDSNFLACNEGIVFDSITGLEWIAGPDRDFKYEDARQWVDALKTAGGGWRMPTLKELNTLFYKGKGTRNMTPLIKNSGEWVWSGEAKDSTTACSFDFIYGEAKTKTARYASKDGRVFAVRLRPSEEEKAPEKEITNSAGMKFVYIPPGSYMMGSPANDTFHQKDEKQHKVILTKGFYMQTTEVTQGQWKKVMGTTPWADPKDPTKGKPGADVLIDQECPATCLSWDMCREFIQKLNEMEGVNTYRLPTESEWEYACRAGSSTRYSFGDDPALMGEYAWYERNAGNQFWYTKKAKDDERYPHRVGTKKPNNWALYDMHGNVLEYCEDWYGEYPEGEAVDPRGPEEGKKRVMRSCTWNSDYNVCFSATRCQRPPDTFSSSYQGFRVVRMPE